MAYASILSIFGAVEDEDRTLPIGDLAQVDIPRLRTPRPGASAPVLPLMQRERCGDPWDPWGVP